MKKTLTLILCSPFFISCVSGTSNSDIIKKLEVDFDYDVISESEVAYTGYSIKNQKYLIDLQNAGGDTFKLDLNIPSEVIIEGKNYSVTVIGRNEFTNVYVRSVVIPKSVTRIEESAFVRYTKLESVDIPNSVTRIGQFAFAGCAKLENIVIPNSVTHIGFKAFAGCAKLENIVIPNSVTHIGSKAFEGCVALRSLVIPASVTSIGAGVFSNCKYLETITFENPEPPYSCSQDDEDSSSDIPLPPPPINEPNLTHVFSGSNVKTVYVPAGAVDTYKEYFSLILGMEINVLPIK
ncbi:MAG: leucine-rich repeat domain-containing protein [Paludibacteraceae bacterium]|nr:leucine-rich repeat domain-containing protein [Paludibacteraceae bacterium]